jgi:hypothetical protein
LEDQETEWDKQENRERISRQLCSTVYGIWQGFVSQIRETPVDGEELAWWTAYEAEREAVKADSCPAYDVWLEEYIKKHGLPSSEAYLRVLYLEQWKKKNRPTGLCAKALGWEKQYFQLLRCQGEWITMQSSCCPDRTEPVAIPIGCNHRLCPLCNWHRSQNSQRTVRKLYDREKWPAFITLTVPNVRRISKRTFEHLRKRARQFFSQHKYMFEGGVYSLETTYNRKEKSWHVHVHALVSSNFRLPEKEQRVDFAGRNMPVFTYLKLALEYDWSRLWCKDFAKRFAAYPRANAKESSLSDERFFFERWALGCRANALREFDPFEKKWKPISSLSDSETAARSEWNIANRRNLWIKRVDDRDRAVKEVLKYITKCVDFIDDADAVFNFYSATRGARLIQTFGSWYGIDLTVEFDTKHPEDWSKLECSCGVNHWERLGVVNRRHVFQQPDGRWRLRPPPNDDRRMDFIRPRIPALEGHREITGDQLWTR